MGRTECLSPCVRRQARWVTRCMRAHDGSVRDVLRWCNAKSGTYVDVGVVLVLVLDATGVVLGVVEVVVGITEDELGVVLEDELDVVGVVELETGVVDELLVVGVVDWKSESNKREGKLVFIAGCGIWGANSTKRARDSRGNASARLKIVCASEGCKPTPY